jgi:hypothetical protein
MKNKSLYIFVYLCLVVFSSKATTLVSSGGGGSWTTAASWSPAQVPTSADSVVVTSGNPITVPGGTHYACCLTTLSGGAMTMTGSIHVGKHLYFRGGVSGVGSLYIDSAGATINDNGSYASQGPVHIYGTVTNLSGSSISTLSTWTVYGGASMTNNGTVTINNTLGYLYLNGSTSTWTQGANSTLTVAQGITGTGTLDASASGNTINYYSTTNIYVANPAYHHLITYSGTKTLVGNITVNGNITLNTSLNGANYSITLKGNWNDFVGVASTVSNLNVIFTGTSTQTMIKSNVPESFVNFTVASTSTVLMSSHMYVNGDLTITTGTLDANTSNCQIYLYGNWANNGGTFTCRSGYVYFFPGTGLTKTIYNYTGTENFFHVYKQNSGTTQLTSHIGLGGTFIMTLGTWDFNTTSKIMTLVGSWSNTGGSVTPGNGQLAFNNSATQTLSRTSGTETFYKLSKANSGQLTLSTPVTTQNLLYHSGGTLVLGATLTCENDLTINSGTLNSNDKAINIGGNWLNSSTYTTGTSYVTFNGTGTQTITKSSGNETFKKLAINKASGTVSLSSPTVVNDTLKLTRGFITSTSTNYLKLIDNAGVIGGSDTSYVNGFMRKLGNDAFKFPVGGSSTVLGIVRTLFHPITISAPSTTSDEFSAQYFNVGQSVGTPLDSTLLERISTCEYWNINRIAGSTNVYATLQWNINSCNVDNTSDLVVSYWDPSGSAKWKSAGNGGMNLTVPNIISNIVIPVANANLVIGNRLSKREYAVLRHKLDGGYFTVTDGNLYFKYAEDYEDTDQKLMINIYRVSDNNLLYTSNTLLSSFYGDNRYYINLLCKGTALDVSGYYVLEVINEKNEKMYLRFKNTTNITCNCTSCVPTN